MNTTLTPNSTSFLSADDLKNIEATIKTGTRVTVKDLAAKHGVKVPIMRDALMLAFAGRIVFKRGRTGGIVLTA